MTQTLGILFDGPGKVARDTLVPTTARHDGIPMVRAASLKESLQGAAMFVGPLAAGLLVAAVNASVTLLVAAAVFVAALVLVAGIRREPRPATQPLTAGSAYRDLREGFGFLLHEPLLGSLTLLLTQPASPASVASLAFGWLVNVTSPATGILTVVASSAVMIAIFCLLPAMRLVDHQPPDTAGRGQGPATAADPQPEPATA